MFHRSLLLTTVLLSLTAACAAPAVKAGHPDTAGLLAGVASVEITPMHPVRLNGFGGRSRESQGVRQSLFAKALAVGSTDADTVLILTVDTLGIPADLMNRVSAALRERLGLSAERLAICASHTHSGPMIRNCANTLFGKPIPEDQWVRILQYSERLEADLVSVAVRAWQSRRPARVSWGIGQVSFALNRRTPGGPVDHDLPVLAVHEPDGGLRAVFTNYACHAVTLSDDLLSGDWPGYAMEHIQRLNPGCEALIAIGCGADSNPRGGVLGGRDDVASSLGLELAEAVNRVLRSDLQPVTEPPRSMLTRFPLPLAPLPSLEEWKQRAGREDAIGYHARVQLQRLERGEALREKLEYSVQTISFGRALSMVFLPGEVVVDYSLRLKRELDPDRLWINAYANDCPGYVPSERVLGEGGYEGGGAMVYYDIPGPWAPGLEEPIIAAVHQQLDDILLRSEGGASIDSSRTNGISPQTPRQSLRSLRTSRGFRVELAAAEPLLQSPVAITFDPKGRVWAAEMADYPQGDPERPGQPGGRVRCLLDSNADGRLDQSVIFLEGLPFPTGVTVWRDGLLICAAPDILFARDTDGDLRADQVERLFTGFATHNFQARVNSLEYGLDGWLYGSCGLFGGDITSTKTGQVIPLGQRDFRCNPDTGAFEAVSGNTQQGRVRNDEGDWFGCNNSVPLMHYPLDESSLRRNPFTAPPQIAVTISASPNPGRLYPISSQVLFALSGPPSSATAACGLGIWRDDLAEVDLRGNAFTCEPVNNLVHRQQLTSRGSTFTSHRAAEEQQQEFLASTDPWFRPVQVRTGPDGALWVVDMYRYVIEHPIWIPPAVLQTLDTRAGHDRGRLYRVLPEARAPRPIPDLSQLAGSELAAAMNSPNGTVRDLVQQLILWNRDMASRPALLELAAQSDRPEVRLQAACTADSLEPLPPDLLILLARDPSPHVRRYAVRLAMPRLQAAPGLAAAVITAAGDPDPKVRLEAAAAAAALPPAQAGPLLAELLASPASDQFLTTIADSSLNSDNVTVVFNSLPADAPETVQQQLLTRIAEMAPLKSALATLGTLAEAAAASVSTEASAGADFRRLSGLLSGWSRRSDAATVTVADLQSRLQPALTVACEVAADPAADAPLRLVAINLLGSASAAAFDQSAALIDLLTPRSPVAVQLAAVTAMAQSRRAELASELLKDWSARSPEIRRAITLLLLQRGEWTERLMTAVESGAVPAAELDVSQRRQLLEHSREAIREAAARCLNIGTAPNRQEIIDRYARVFDESTKSSGTAVTAPDLIAGGLAAFRKHCANCHRLQEIGYAVGPDIANYAAKSPLALITAVLDPNQAVDPRYQSTGIVLQDGRTLTGLITSETDNSLTLLAPEGRSTQLLRSEIDQLRSTGKSLMPENLEQTVSAAELHLIWLWIRAQRQPPKQLDGNSPQLLELPSAGNVILNASTAEIRGGDITFEQPFQNVGYWHGTEDHVRWTLRSAITRDVDVWAEWACHPDSAGNGFVLEVPGRSLSGTVDSSGGWDRYQLQHLGTLTLTEGDLELIVRPSGPIRGALADLRAIHLTADGSVPLARGMQQAEFGIPANAAPAELAAWLLNDSVPPSEREAVLNREMSRSDRRPPESVLAAMAQTLPKTPGSAEEYRRIPWIWRVAIGVGRSGTEEQFAAVLRCSLPELGQPLQHWQAVVVGGGLINGLSLSGRWPHEVIPQVIRKQPELEAAWQATLNASAAMASDAGVPTGTRYDALRIAALLPWPAARRVLTPWLQPDSHSELQMGAVSGLGDVPNEEAARLLVDSFKGLTPENQTLALEALRRTPERRQLLEDAQLNGSSSQK